MGPKCYFCLGPALLEPSGGVSADLSGDRSGDFSGDFSGEFSGDFFAWGLYGLGG